MRLRSLHASAVRSTATPRPARARRLAALLAAGSGLAVGCAGGPAPQSFEELPSAEELYARGEKQMAEDGGGFWIFKSDYADAIESFQDIVDNYPYSDQATLAQLVIADAYFKQEKYEEALSYYRDFVELHPEHDKVSYAMFQTAMAYYRQSRDASRDQTATEQAVEQLDRLLARFPDSPYAPEAEKMWTELRTRLGEHTLRVANYYFGDEEYPSAAERYRQVLERYPGLGLDAEALYRLGVCYTRMNRTDEAREIFQVILDKYQGTDVAKAAADLVPEAY